MYEIKFNEKKVTRGFNNLYSEVVVLYNNKVVGHKYYRHTIKDMLHDTTIYKVITRFDEFTEQEIKDIFDKLCKVIDLLEEANNIYI